MDLKSINIYGYEAIEELLGAALLTGEPLCLIGEKGTAKTYMCRRIAESIGVKFGEYNSSTINFQDLSGFPMPEKDEDGTWKKHMEYIETPATIWEKEFILLDELNRALIDRQNDLLTLLRSRVVQGKKVKGLKWVWAAVNPLSYSGTQPMTEALADRFSLLARIPSFAQLAKEAQMNIISNVTSSDLPAISFWGEDVNNRVAQVGRLKDFFNDARKYYDVFSVEYDQAISEYVREFCSELKSNSEAVFVDGRRAAMLKRNIIAIASVKMTKEKTKDIDIEDVIKLAVNHSFPNELIDNPIDPNVINSAHAQAKTLVISSQDAELVRLRAIKDPFKLAAAILNSKNVNPIAATELMEKAQNKFMENKLNNDSVSVNWKGHRVKVTNKFLHACFNFVFEYNLFSSSSNLHKFTSDFVAKQRKFCEEFKYKNMALQHGARGRIMITNNHPAVSPLPHMKINAHELYDSTYKVFKILYGRNKFDSFALFVLLAAIDDAMLSRLNRDNWNTFDKKLFATKIVIGYFMDLFQKGKEKENAR